MILVYIKKILVIVKIIGGIGTKCRQLISNMVKAIC